MSSSAYAYLVVGVRFSDVGKTYEESRKLVRYNTHTGQKYEIEITQTVVEILGQKIPDEPDVDSPVWNGFDCRWGTKPIFNLFKWLQKQDERWAEEKCSRNLSTLGVLVASAYVGDCTNAMSEIGDFTQEKVLAEELLRSIGYKGEVKLLLYAGF